MTLVIKKIDEKKLREFKAEAIRRGLTLSEAISQAIDLWLNKVRSEDDEDVEKERELNNKVFEELKDNLPKDKYIVIANGKLIGTFDSLKEVSDVLKGLKVKHAIVVNMNKDSQREGEWLSGSMFQ
ncbi:hypothetical protein [Saccharolobus caldissimus]|uniref:Uncharacterized protein n=1 Tax=Saccharolobus caldissimus TaxID=1702097 RepID=A0AAQ4CVZ1_9CREN|nr:hypothetical protein [Saccharolobus caldissimus]BDB99972.1 hypothetical protein SACC_29890 [Saccharolobus caldissimus]